MKPKHNLLALFFLLAFAASATAQNKTENVILITLDGARNQELFGGLDLDILKNQTRQSRRLRALQKILGRDSRSPPRKADALLLGHADETAWLNCRQSRVAERCDDDE
ncbi:MAG: hypothetical protein M3X11_10380 [Acidobacteriota bacterium]|nr:hypothetical protein [Acidobacteriota bacterium]